MKIISINCGSSSLRFSLFDMTNEKLIASGHFERVNQEGSFYVIKYNGNEIREEIEMPNHSEAVNIMLNRLVSIEIIKNINEINGIGHRIVHGGSKYNSSVIINDEVLEDIKKYTTLAPLHNPANILGIETLSEVLPNIPAVGVFDTAFHQTINKVNYIYPLPYNWYEEYGLRKYGFHGTSYSYITKQIPAILEKDNYKAIICHLGNGGSLAAIKDGKCIDTSMGFTPLAGIMMGTRSGDIDPSIIEFIMKKEKRPIEDVMNDLNKKSGLFGVSKFSNDLRDIDKGIKEGNELCALALDKYVETITDYIGSYYVKLGGLDILIFTAGAGEMNPTVRELIVNKLACLGIKLNLEANKIRGELVDITDPNSRIKVYVIPINEELEIALDTYNLLKEQ